MREEFVRMYGEIGEHLDEDKWLTWYGIFVSGWQSAMDTYESELKKMRPELASLLTVAGKSGTVHSRGNPANKPINATVDTSHENQSQ